MIKSEKENLQEVERLVTDLKSRSKSSEETFTCPKVTCPTQKPCPSQEACPTPKVETSEEDLGTDLKFLMTNYFLESHIFITLLRKHKVWFKS